VDIITLTEELSKKKEVESVGGVAYISSLTDGLPRRPSIAQYVRIVRDKALLRSLIHACSAAMSRAADQAEPAAEIIDAAESAIFQISENRIGQGFLGIPDIVKQSFGSIDALYERGRRITGLETYYDKLDEMTSGLQPSDLIIIAARPSMGKTAFAINIAENAAVRGKKVVGVFSLEMSREALVLRMLSSQAHVDSQKLRSGFLSRDDRQKLVSALSALAEAPIFIDDTPGIALTEMRAKARRLMQQHGQLDLIVVDYLQLMSGGGGKRYEKRPQLSDLRESGSIEQDADVVAFIFREEYYLRDEVPPELEGVAEIIIAKQRNGPTGSLKLAFLKNSTRFENMAEGAGPTDY
jgi:replicative DNA helicase